MNSARRQDFDRVFERFWPRSLPWPPMAVYLASVSTRSEAYESAIRLRADEDPGILSGDITSLMSFLGKCLQAEGVYAEERRRRKKKEVDATTDCALLRQDCEARCGGAENVQSFRCDPNTGEFTCACNAIIDHPI